MTRADQKYDSKTEIDLVLHLLFFISLESRKRFHLFTKKYDFSLKSILAFKWNIYLYNNVSLVRWMESLIFFSSLLKQMSVSKQKRSWVELEATLGCSLTWLIMLNVSLLCNKPTKLSLLKMASASPAMDGTQQSLLSSGELQGVENTVGAAVWEIAIICVKRCHLDRQSLHWTKGEEQKTHEEKDKKLLLENTKLDFL